MTLKHLDLFSGIGGFALAARWTGEVETKQFVEIESFCHPILEKNFPGVPIHSDVKTYEANEGDFDLITAGFPCQDLSVAGKREGIHGKRSGLFFEVVRIVRMVRPRFILLENVSGLLIQGMGDVLRELSKAGYDAQWDTISCSEIGGIHQRKRVWIIAYSSKENCRGLSIGETTAQSSTREPFKNRDGVYFFANSNQGRTTMEESQNSGQAWEFNQQPKRTLVRSENGKDCTERNCSSHSEVEFLSREGSRTAKPNICRKDDGVSFGLDGSLMEPMDLENWLPLGLTEKLTKSRVKRLQALGNAIVPQVVLIPMLRIVEMAK